MASEIINIATLTIDRTEANNSITDTKKQIFELQKANSELRKDITKNGDASGEQTKAFVENEQALKKLTAQYRTQSAAINDLTLAELKEDKALTESAKSRAQAIAQTKELKAVRDQLNTSTEEGAKALELLNKKIDDNDKFLKNSASSQEKAATISGNYRQALFGVDAALSKFGIDGEQARNVVKGFGDGVTGAAKSVTDFTAKAFDSTRATIGFKTAQQAASETQIVSTTVTEAQAVATVELAAGQEIATVATDASTISMYGFATALAATGIGAIVILVVALISYLSKLDPVLDAIEQITAGVAAAFSSLGKAIYNLDFSNLIGGMGEAYDAASKLAEAQQNLQDLQSSQEVANAKASQQYDELILKSKNRTLTEKQRIEFLNKAQKIEEDNFKQRANLANVDLKLALESARIKGELSRQEIENLNRNTIAYANYLLQQGKITQKEYDAIKKAELGKIEILAESTKRLEKSQNAEDKLADDAAAKEKARQDKAKADADKALQAKIKAMETSIAIERAKNAQIKLSDQEQLAFLNDITQKELALVEFKRAQGLITEKEASLASLTIAKNQSAEILKLAEESINSEIEAQNKKFEARKKLNEEQMIDEVSNAAFLRDTQIKRIEDSTLLESEKAAALIEIQKGYISSIDIIEKTYSEAKKLQNEIDLREAQTLADVAFEMRILQLQDQGLTELDIQKATLALQLEQKKATLDAELENEKKTAAEVTALKKLEDEKYAAATKKIDKEVLKTKKAAQFGIVQDSLAAASLIFEDSKALAIASALINTYQGITAIWAAPSTLPEPYGTIGKVAATAVAAASGFAAVRNIVKTNKGSGGGGGGASSGSSSSSSSVSTGGSANTQTSFDNPARTQTIATVDQAPIINAAPSQTPVLVLETLDEVKGQQQIKIKSS